MILIANRNTKTFVETVDQTVGTAFSLLERWRMGGIGSGRLLVTASSEGLKNCFGATQDTKFVIIEMRRNGIIVHIRNAINNYVWLIPYYRLSIFKSDFLGIHGAGEYIRIDLGSLNGNNSSLIKKVLSEKANYSTDQLM